MSDIKYFMVSFSKAFYVYLFQDIFCMSISMHLIMVYEDCRVILFLLQHILHKEAH